MTVGSILEGAFSLLKNRPGSVAVWGLINLATTIGTAFALAALVDVQLMSGPDMRWSFLGNLLLVLLVIAMISVVLYTAALRAMLRPGEHALASLRLGMDEVRQFLVALLYLFIFLIALFILSFVLVIFTGGGGLTTPGSSAIWLFYILIYGAGAWFYTKVSLSFPLTLKERRFVIGEAWSLTAGRFWTLLGAYAVIFVMMFALSLLVGLATQQTDLSTLFMTLQGQETGFSDFDRLRYEGIDAMMILGWVLSAALGTIGLTLWAGATATAAREVSGDVDGLAETFS
jgi:hypothetical protein